MGRLTGLPFAVTTVRSRISRNSSWEGGLSTLDSLLGVSLLAIQVDRGSERPERWLRAGLPSSASSSASSSSRYAVLSIRPAGADAMQVVCRADRCWSSYRGLCTNR